MNLNYQESGFKISMCDCGSIFAPVYWNFKKQKFTCKLCVGYPDDSHLYKHGEK